MSIFLKAKLLCDGFNQPVIFAEFLEPPVSRKQKIHLGFQLFGKLQFHGPVGDSGFLLASIAARRPLR